MKLKDLVPLINDTCEVSINIKSGNKEFLRVGKIDFACDYFKEMEKFMDYKITEIDTFSYAKGSYLSIDIEKEPEYDKKN